MTRFLVLSFFLALPLMSGDSVFALPTTGSKKALWSAVEDGRQSQVEKQLQAKTDINAQDTNGETALIKAVANGNGTMAKLLLKHHANINLTDKDGNTALFYAVSNHDEKLATELVRAGADLSRLYGEKKESILFEAARANASLAAKLILQKDPSLATQLNVDGQNALFPAAALGNVEVTRVLIRKLNGTLKDHSGKTPFDLAKEAGFKKTLEALSSVSP